MKVFIYYEDPEDGSLKREDFEPKLFSHIEKMVDSPIEMSWPFPFLPRVGEYIHTSLLGLPANGEIDYEFMVKGIRFKNWGKPAIDIYIEDHERL